MVNLKVNEILFLLLLNSCSVKLHTLYFQFEISNYKYGRTCTKIATAVQILLRILVPIIQHTNNDLQSALL